MSRPSILITNDDGIAAPGLRWLAHAAREHEVDVVVAAPSQEASGMSAALTAVVDQGRVVIEKVTLASLEDVAAYSVAASPSYIVVLAGLGAFGPAPSVVLSGINRGANAGRAILHSGTVGAALTAANAGLRAMAVSLDVLTGTLGDAASGGAAIADLDTHHDDLRNWATAASLAGRLLPSLLASPPATVWNLNVPDLPTDQLRGLRQADLAPFGQVQMAIAETGEGFVRTAIEQHADRQIPGTDVALLAAAFATITEILPPAPNPTNSIPADITPSQRTGKV
jgi:5'-nucleotidase